MFSSFWSAEVRTPLNVFALPPIDPKPSAFGSLTKTKNTAIMPLKICIAKIIQDLKKFTTFQW